MYNPLTRYQFRILKELAADEQCRIGLSSFPEELIDLLSRQNTEYLQGYIACLYDTLALIGKSLKSKEKVSTFEWILMVLKTSAFVIKNLLGLRSGEESTEQTLWN